MDEEEFFAKLAEAQAALGGGAAATVPMVWMGDTQGGTSIPLHKSNTVVKVPEEPVSVAADEAVLEFQSWSGAQMQAFQKQLEKSGIVADTIFELEAQWSAVVDIASRSYAAYQAGIIDNPQTPMDILKNMGQLGVEADINKPVTTTATETTQLSASGARALGEATFQSELGRDPTGGQMGGLANSTTASRTTTTDPDGNTTTSVQEGADLGQLGIEYARSQDDYAEYQASTTYMQAFLDSIGAVA